MPVESRLIHVQNITDIRDPGQVDGLRGASADKARFLLARGLHPALTGDKVIVSDQTPEDYPKYLRAVTGQNPELVRTRLVVPLFTRDLLASVGPGDTDFALNPYIQWRSVAQHSQETGVPLSLTPAERVLGGVVETANDKAYFREMAGPLGIPMVEGQKIVDVSARRDIRDATEQTVREYDGAFIQANKSGGGLGNVDIKLNEAGEYVSKLGVGLDTILGRLSEWSGDMEQAGSGKVIISPYLHLQATHTVSGYIPPKGEPIAYGTFGQIVNESHDYEGFEYPANDIYTETYGKQMQNGAANWFGHLQGLGYVGPSDVDYIVGTNPHIAGEVVAGCESNSRWNGFRSGLQHLAMMQGWNLRDLSGIDPNNSPAIRAVDMVPTRAINTTEIVTRLQESDIPLLGINNEERGVLVMLPPTQKDGEQTTALAVIADNPKEAHDIFMNAENKIK